jgi:hypothetical protein
MEQNGEEVMRERRGRASADREQDERLDERRAVGTASSSLRRELEEAQRMNRQVEQRGRESDPAAGDIRGERWRCWFSM